MSQSQSIDYPTRTKQGVLVGVSLFVVGAIGELLGHTYLPELPGWEQTVLFYAMVFGTLIALLSVLVFGFALPLVE